MTVTQFLSTVVEEKRLSTSPDRFEWCTAWKQDKSTGSWVTRKVEDNSSRPAEDRPVPFEYLCDRATGELYMAHHPNVLSLCFVCAVLATPIMAVATVCANVAKLALILFGIIQQTFNKVYPERHHREFVKLSLESFEINLDSSLEKLIDPLCKIYEAFWYAVAIEVASLNALIYFYDVKEVLKMWMVTAQVEKIWNQDADFRRTPFSALIRFGKNLEKNGLDSLSTGEESSLLRPFYQAEPTCYMFQCFQSLGRIDETIDVGGDHEKKKFEIRNRFDNYEELQGWKLGHPEN